MFRECVARPEWQGTPSSGLLTTLAECGMANHGPWFIQLGLPCLPDRLDSVLGDDPPNLAWCDAKVCGEVDDGGRPCPHDEPLAQ